jgi:alpha-ribazole phosphatase
MEVYIIRHTPVAIGKDTCYGQSNVPLADTFLQDAEKLKNQLPNDFDAIYCSPLERCKDLATALEYTNIHIDNALLEMNFGDWENKKWNDLNQEDLNNWMTDFVKVKTPNGENLIELFDRVKQFLDNLRKQQHKKVLLITHAGVIRCVWTYLLQIPLTNIFKIPVDYGQKLIINLSTEHNLDSIKKIG